jgi:hypothetical protein
MRAKLKARERFVRIGGKPFRTIWPDSDAASVQIIDQTRLPHEFEIISIKTASEAARAIKDMQVRVREGFLTRIAELEETEAMISLPCKIQGIMKA